MIRTTLGDARAKTFRIPEALNIPPNDSRFIDYVNQAEFGLLNRGLYWGSYGRYAVAITSQLLTLPAEIDTVESMLVDSTPCPVRNGLFEFLGNGWGGRHDSKPTGIWEGIYRGNFPTFVDITDGSPGTLTGYCDVAADVGKQVLLLGYDENNNWIRSLVGGVWQDGVVLSLAQTPGTATTKQFSKIVGVQVLSALDGQWWLYLGAVIGGTLLSNYQYYETNPSYKRYLIPYCSNPKSHAVILGKRAYIPVKNDTDYLILGNLRALKLACMAVRAEEDHNWSEAQLLWSGGKDSSGNVRLGATNELDAELAHHIGTGVQAGITLNNAPGHTEMVESLM